MESLLLMGTVFAVVLVAYYVSRNDPSSDKPALGIFSFKASATSKPPRKGRPDA